MNQSKSASMLDARILVPAIGDAFRKLNPKSLAKNPVMFVVAVVSVLTTVLLLKDIATGAESVGFSLQIVLWCQSASKRDPLSACNRDPLLGFVMDVTSAPLARVGA